MYFLSNSRLAASPNSGSGAKSTLGKLDFWSLKGFAKKLKADFQYGKDQEKTGKGSITAYTRTVLLWLSTPLFYIYLIFKR